MGTSTGVKDGTAEEVMPAMRAVFRVALTFGHQGKDGGPVRGSRIRWVEREVLVVLSRLFGGAQVNGHRGSYRKENGSVIFERATTLWAYAAEVEPHMEKLQQLAGQVAAVLKQEAVLLAVEQTVGFTLFVEPGKDGPNGRLKTRGRRAVVAGVGPAIHAGSGRGRCFQREIDSDVDELQDLACRPIPHSGADGVMSSRRKTARAPARRAECLRDELERLLRRVEGEEENDERP